MHRLHLIHFIADHEEYRCIGCVGDYDIWLRDGEVNLKNWQFFIVDVTGKLVRGFDLHPVPSSEYMSAPSVEKRDPDYWRVKQEQRLQEVIAEMGGETFRYLLHFISIFAPDAVADPIPAVSKLLRENPKCTA